MAVKTKAQLVAYSEANFLTDGRRTRAASLRTFVNDLMDSVISGVMPATAGLIPFCTGAAATIETSEDFYFDDGTLVVINNDKRVTIGPWIGMEGQYSAIYFADDPSTEHFSLAGNGSLTFVRAGTSLIMNVASAIVGKFEANKINFTEFVHLGNDDTSVPGDRLSVDGNLAFIRPRDHIKLVGGTDAYIGEATLSGGTVTVSHSAVVSGVSRIFLSRRTGNPRVLTYSIVDNTSFTINSGDGSDNGIISYIIFTES